MTAEGLSASQPRFSADSNFDTSIWVVAADNPEKGQTLIQVITNPREDEQPAWSPDGK